MSGELSRREQLSHGFADVHRRIEQACRRVDRDPAGVGLIVVTKTFPASDVRLLAGLGATDVGENKHQEARAKHAECADLDLRWHFVGRLQSNKAGGVAAYADLVHSVDRPKLVRALDRGAQAAGRRLGCLVQVSLDGDPAEGRSGAEPEGVAMLADLVAEADSLDLAGVMGVAPLRGDPDKAFGRLAEVAQEVQARHPAATMVSAGMSGDLEAAIAHGATHVRVGSAVLGAREVLG